MNSVSEKGSHNLSIMEMAPAIVFQPKQLTEIVDMIDLMGKVSERIREEGSQDLGGGAMVKTVGGQSGSSGQSARDTAIAAIPAMPVMQQKLVSHIQSEIQAASHQARRIARAKTRGSAYLLAELYKKIRRLSSLIDEILHASLDVVKRFYIAVFIDRQSLVTTGSGNSPLAQ